MNSVNDFLYYLLLILDFLMPKRTDNYQEYLRSSKWRGKRKEALGRAGYRCQLCNSPTRLQVHHRTYDRLGNERPDDLIVLCQKCHTAFHAHRKLHKPRKRA